MHTLATNRFIAKPLNLLSSHTTERTRLVPGGTVKQQTDEHHKEKGDKFKTASSQA